MHKATALIAVLLVALAGLIYWAVREDPVGSLHRPDGASLEIPDGEYATSTEAYDIEVSVPASSTPAAEAAAGHIREVTQQFIADAQAAHAAYEQSSSNAGERPWIQHALSVGYESYEAGGYISYVVSEYRFTGGANGVQLVATFNYASDGSSITLGDIVVGEDRDALLGALREELYEINGADAGAGAFNEEIEGLSVSDISSFYLTQHDIGVMFDEYEVAPGAAGAVRVELPREAYVTI